MVDRPWGFKSPPEHHISGRIGCSNNMKLVIATRNLHKLDEIRAILTVPSLELVDLRSFPNAPEIVEDGCTFEHNAIKKAAMTARAIGQWCMADDSGLEVDFLRGDPGVYSARYAGEPANHPANNAKLLNAMKDAKDRRARFCCVVALASPRGIARTVPGYCHGQIIREPRGTAGFGYDPLFIPDGQELTFAELGETIKNGISHRARALERAKAVWQDLLSGHTMDWSEVEG